MKIVTMEVPFLFYFLFNVGGSHTISQMTKFFIYGVSATMKLRFGIFTPRNVVSGRNYSCNGRLFYDTVRAKKNNRFGIHE